MSEQSKESEDIVVVEVMPDWCRESHRQARNWGVYPHNGANRFRAPREVAEQLCEDDPDNYNSIVRCSPEQAAEYPSL